MSTCGEEDTSMSSSDSSWENSWIMAKAVDPSCLGSVDKDKEVPTELIKFNFMRSYPFSFVKIEVGVTESGEVIKGRDASGFMDFESLDSSDDDYCGDSARKRKGPPKFFYRRRDNTYIKVDDDWYMIGGNNKEDLDWATFFDVLGREVLSVHAMYRMNAITQREEELAWMPTAVCFPAVVALDGKIYVIGGEQHKSKARAQDMSWYRPEVHGRILERQEKKQEGKDDKAGKRDKAGEEDKTEEDDTLMGQADGFQYFFVM